MYRCHCNKNYKTFYGLKNHAKQCSANLTSSNPIDKLNDLKTTTVVNNNGTTTISSSPNTQTNQNKISSPIMSVSIATATPVTNQTSPTTNTELKNQILDDSMEDNNLNKQIQIKTPTLQHLLSPIV